MDNESKLSKSFDLGTACAAVLVGFGVQVVFQFIISLIPLSDAVRTWMIVILNQIVFFAVAMVFARVKKVDLLSVTGVKDPPKWYYFPLFILIAVACVACFAPISGLFRRLLERWGYDHTPQYFIPRDSAGLFTLAFFALTILPVLGEEVMLRGVLMSGAKRKSPLFAIFYTALIFALLHGNLNQLVHQFLLGAVMGYLAYLTGGIYASATIHMTNNAIAMLLDYGFMHNFVNKNFYYYVAGELGATATIVGVSLSFFGLVMLIVLVTCLLHRDRSKVKDYFSAEGSALDKVKAYLIYLSTPTVEKENEAKQEQGVKLSADGYTLLLVILLAAVLGVVVLASIFAGGNG